MMRNAMFAVLLGVCGCDSATELAAPMDASPEVLLSTAEPPARAVVMPAPGPTIRGQEGGWVYPCADPTDICEHLESTGCSTWRPASCRDTVAALGEDVCLALYEAKTVLAVRALGVSCAAR